MTPILKAIFESWFGLWESNKTNKRLKDWRLYYYSSEDGSDDESTQVNQSFYDSIS